MLLRDLISRKKILFDLKKNIPDKLLNHDVCGISANSKDIRNNYIFVAIKGQNFDGSDFIHEAKKMVPFLLFQTNPKMKMLYLLTKYQLDSYILSYLLLFMKSNRKKSLE